MAIKLRGATDMVGANSTSRALSQPTGTSDHDFMIAIVMDKATSGSSTAPDGWTWLCGAAGANGRLQIFYAIKGWSANLPVATSWTWTGLTARSAGRMVAYYNADHTGLSGTATARYNASGTYGTTGLTTSAAGAMVIGVFAAFGATPTWSAEACTDPSSLSEANGAADSAYSTYHSCAVAAAIRTNAGATGASTATPSTGAINAAALLALNPTTGGKIKVWDGNQWVQKTGKVRVGTAWESKPWKRWTGSAWVVIDVN